MTPGSSKRTPAPSSATRPTPRWKIGVFLLVATMAVLISGGYLISARLRAVSGEARREPPADPRVLASVSARPHVVFVTSDQSEHRVAVMLLNNPSVRAVLTPLSCERVYYAAGHGICLSVDRTGLTRYNVSTFDNTFNITQTSGLQGIPSRTRISNDGRRAAFTVFVSGDSYSTAGFSTRTELIDLDTGASLGDLEQFTVLKDGQPFRAVDFNFWGVTFADDLDLFYATLATGGRTYLVRGQVKDRTATVIAQNVECPSLSPDGTRVAFKKRVAKMGLTTWRLAVLDLKTGKDIVLEAETRNVDDQAEWLDKDHVLYALPDETALGKTNVWVANADGTGRSRIYLKNAASPAVVHPTSLTAAPTAETIH